jgi:hypothetical protein
MSAALVADGSRLSSEASVGRSICLLNISSSGMLVESGVRLFPAARRASRLVDLLALVVPGREMPRPRLTRWGRIRDGGRLDRPVAELIASGKN